MSENGPSRKELMKLQDNIRKHVHSLELCWSCNRISECDGRTIRDGLTLWLCSECQAKYPRLLTSMSKLA